MEPRYIGILLFLIFSFIGQTNGQCLLSCNGQVNVALDVDCEVDIKLNMLVPGEPPESCLWSFELEGIDGTIVDEPGWVTYTVTNDVSGASCSGQLLIEDKIPPELDCECSDYNLEVDNFNGTLNSNSQTFNRPANNNLSGCQSGFNVSYEVFNFTTNSFFESSQEGSFTIEGENLFLSLYEHSFDPSHSCTNLIAVAGNGMGITSLTSSLQDGLSYFLVVSNFVDMGTESGDIQIDVEYSSGSILTKNPNCRFSCTDLFEPSLLDSLLPPIEIPTDNCNYFVILEPSISITDADDCGSKLVTRSTGYVYNQNTGHQQTEYCVEQFLFEAIQLTNAGNTIDGVWEEYPSDGVHDYYFPQKEIFLPCGSGFHPNIIAEYFDIDTPNTSPGLMDDYQETHELVENHEGIPYATPYFTSLGYDGNYHAVPLTENACNLDVVYHDQLFDLCGPGCLGNSKTVRTWTFYDWCKGTVAHFDQTIIVTDIDGPDVSVSDITVSVDPWNCYADIEMPEPNHITDDCDNVSNYWIQNSDGILMSGYTALHVPIGHHNFTYYGQDCCGNVSTSEVRITVRDNTAPVAVTQESLVIQLTTDLQGDGVAKIFAEDIDNHSFDACSDVKLEVRRNDGNIWCHQGNATFNDDGHTNDTENDDDNGAFVMFCCEDLVLIDDDGQTYGLYDVQLRVWDDGDGNGIYGSAGDNYNESWTTIRVEDKLSPIVDCPENIEINCNEDFANLSLTGQPTAQGPCFPSFCEEPIDTYVRKAASSAPFVGEEIPAYDPSCRQGAIRRTWYCGGSNCSQWIIVRPAEEASLEIEWPEDQTIDCLGEVYGEPSFTDNICETIGVSMRSDTFYFTTGTCYRILNHWSVIEWCNYDASDSDNNDIVEPGLDDGFVEGVYNHIQVIRLFDTVDPILSVRDTIVSSNSECQSENIVLKAFAEDNGACGTDWLKWEVEVDLGSDWNVDYTYSTSLPSNDPFYLSPTLDTMYLTLPDGLDANCSQSHRVQWKVEDGCGNITSQSQSLTIKDLKSPTPYCLNLSSALMANGRVELWARDFDAGSFDNCTGQDYLMYSFSPNVPPQLIDPNEENPWYDENGVTNQNNYVTGDAELWNDELRSSSKIFDCDELEQAFGNGGIYPLAIYVWDLCGNFDYCSVNLQLTDNESACGLTDLRAMIAGTVENESGEMIEGISMSVNSELPSYPREVITDADGSYSFLDNPMYNQYQLTGEKNDDWLNGVTTLDIVLIQKHILGLLDLQSPYKMIAADANNDEKISAVDLVKLRKLILGLEEDIPGNSSWRLVPKGLSMNIEQPWPFDEMIHFSDLDQSEHEADFIGIKVGDVNDSAILSFNTQQIASRALPQMSIRVEQNVSDNYNRIDFICTRSFYLSGFQFALSGLNTQPLELQSAKLNMATDNYHHRPDALLVSWNTSEQLLVEESELLFSIKVQGSQISDLTFDESLIANEMYVGDKLDAYNLKLIQSNNASIQESFVLAPNPMSDSAKLKFQLHKEQDIEIFVHDVSGKLIYKFEAFGHEGNNEIQLKISDLRLTTGLYFISLETQHNRFVRRATVVE